MSEAASASPHLSLTTAGSPGRDAATVTAWNVVSRVSGFGRVLVVGGALGASRLGDTFQASNQVSNVLFEFLAAGTLSAVLVPGLVARAQRHDRAAAEAFASGLLARALAVLAPVVLVAMLFAHTIMRLLVAGNNSTSRHAQIRLGAFFLLFVLPQVVLYAWGAIVTAALHAEGRFAAAAAAPVANNVVVTAAVGLFWARDSSGLGIGGVDQLLLGAGALGGVLCMTLVPALAARRAGMRIAPRWRSGDGYSASLRDAAWASLVVIPAQLFLVGSIVVANRVAGGVVAIQVAFTLFLLPHALLAHPFTTVLYPRIAGAWVDSEQEAVRRESGRGLLVTLILTAPAAAMLCALAPWVTRLIAVGALGRGAGPEVVSAALFGYAIGLPFYSWSLLLARISYAVGDVRAPGVWAMAGGAAGGLVLVLGARHADAATLRWIGIAHATMVLVAAAAVLAVLARRGLTPVDGRWVTAVVSAVVAGFAARFVADATNDAATRLHALAALAGGGAAGVVVYGVSLRAGGIRFRTLRELTT